MPESETNKESESWTLQPDSGLKESQPYLFISDGLEEFKISAGPLFQVGIGQTFSKYYGMSEFLELIPTLTGNKPSVLAGLNIQTWFAVDRVEPELGKALFRFWENVYGVLDRVGEHVLNLELNLSPLPPLPVQSHPDGDNNDNGEQRRTWLVRLLRLLPNLESLAFFPGNPDGKCFFLILETLPISANFVFLTKLGFVFR